MCLVSARSIKKFEKQVPEEKEVGGGGGGLEGGHVPDVTLQKCD